mgnify:CR=1 FL=1
MLREQERFLGSTRGALLRLLDRGTYLDRDDYDQLQESTTGEFGGLALDRLDDTRMRVTQRYHVVVGVEVVMPLDVDQVARDIVGVMRL